MNEYKVSFYTAHNPGMQFDIIKANSKQEVHDIFTSNACEVISIEELNRCICLEIIGDNGDCPKHGKGLEKTRAFSDAEIKADYQERNDLYNMGMGA